MRFISSVRTSNTRFDSCVRVSCLFVAVAYARGDPVLVYSDRGVSRSAAVVVAFVSFQMRLSAQVRKQSKPGNRHADRSLQEALDYVERHRSVRPQQSFVACIDQMNEKLRSLKDAMSNANQTTD